MTARARDILKSLGEYPNGNDPHGQMDQAVVIRCQALSTKSDLNADDVKILLDDCVHGSLCTDFVVMALDIAWKELSGVLGKPNET